MLSISAAAEANDELIKRQAIQATQTGSPWLSSRLLTPHLSVSDPEKSKQFYKDAFGFELRHETKSQGTPVHVEMSYQGELAIMFALENPATSANANVNSRMKNYTYLYVSDVEQTVKAAALAGGKIIKTPSLAAWGDKFAIIEDLDQYRWGVAEAKSFPGN